MEFRDIQKLIEEIQEMAHAVYTELGRGYDEAIYAEALMVELRKARISYERERYVPVVYGDHVIGTGRADIVVIPNRGLPIPIECKKTGLGEGARQQLRTYMKGLRDNCAHGILIGFPQPEIDPLELYWARKGEEGTVTFYRHSSGNWVPDDNTKTPNSKGGTEKKTKTQRSTG